MQTALPASSVIVISKTNTFVLPLNECIHTGWQQRGYPFLWGLLKFQLERWSNAFFKREEARQKSHLRKTKVSVFDTPVVGKV